jgi:putative ABC transport system permease protein
VLCAFVLESIVLCVVGGAIGAVASLAMRYAHFSMMNMNSWSDITFSFEPSPRVLFIAVSAAGFMGLFGGFLPALRAARTSPLAALRED